jgi:DNA-binding transcriptional regulator YbjK
MSLSDINTYIGLKATLLSQINADDTVANIQTTFNSITSQKATILANLPSSTVLDTDASNTISTPDKINFILTVRYCRDNDTQLLSLLMNWYDKLAAELNAATDPTVIANLQAKITSQISIIKSVIPSLFTDLINFITQNP